jgi:hypothetical protein
MTMGSECLDNKVKPGPAVHVPVRKGAPRARAARI